MKNVFLSFIILGIVTMNACHRDDNNSSSNRLLDGGSFDSQDGGRYRELTRNYRNLDNAISIYYGDMEGQYPTDLSVLVPRYISAIPPCRVPGRREQTGVEYFDTSVTDQNGVIDRSRLRNTGKWGYVRNLNLPDGGFLFVDAIEIGPDFYTQGENNLANLASLRSAVAVYFGDFEGIFPSTLETLVPRYILHLPPVNTHRHGIQYGVTNYNARPRSRSDIS
jgi:hypothetical protein